jgi:hypothetical protein
LISYLNEVEIASNCCNLLAIVVNKSESLEFELDAFLGTGLDYPLVTGL